MCTLPSFFFPSCDLIEGGEREGGFFFFLLTALDQVHAREAGLAEESEREERSQDWGPGYGCDGLVFPCIHTYLPVRSVELQSFAE